MDLPVMLATSYICDMIKGNESDIANIDFELYRLKEVTNSNVLHCLEFQRFAHISWTQILDCMGVWIKISDFKWTSRLY